ncbi:MAG: ATP-binding protein [Gemmatimonadota bacterium]|jgi:predicted ATPase with chaperone activity
MNSVAETSTGVQIPPAPVTLADTGLSAEAVIELILKTLFVQGAQTGQQLTQTICLPFDIIDAQLLALQSRRFIEVTRTHGPARGNYVFDVVGPGRERAAAAVAASQYVGAAPVPLAAYREWLEQQSVRTLHAGREQIRRGFSHLILADDVLESLGPAVNSASSLFLYGDPGNGKTVIAEAIAGLLGGDIYIPFAVEVGGQIMVLYDPVHHKPVDETGPASEEDASPWLHGGSEHDRRFIRVRRPVIFVGGELSLEQLDLQYDTYSKIYQAPFQLKAGGGVLIIDDFGRQLVPPRDLLNRWIVPLEKRVDFLTLHTGVKFPVPFDCLLVFATNLNPHELVDEAFLRRIQYKINIHGPDPSAYRDIFKDVCEANHIRYDPAAVDYIYDHYYDGRGIPPRACHPRDIIDHLMHASRYEQREPRFTFDLLERACHSYFLVMAPGAVA